MGKSLNSFRSLIAKKQSSSEPDEVAGAVADVERVEAMLRESALDVTWAASVKERLRKRAAALIRKPREVDERRRMLDKVLGAFARRDVDPGAEIERLRDDTLDLEASDAFAELAERWHDAKAAPGEIRMQDLDRQITDFRRRHADRLAEDAKKLKDEVVSACERHAWDGIVDDYRAFRDSLEEADYRQLEDSLNRYETRFSPFRFDHRVVDVTDFQRRLEEAPCVKVTAWAMVSGLQAEVRNDSRECRSGRFRLFDRKKIIRVEWRRRDEEGKLGKWLEGEMELGSLLTGNVKLADGEVEVTWVRAWPDLPTAR